MKISGKLVKVLATESGTSKSGKEWTKRNFVLNTGSEYNPEVCCQVFGEEKSKALDQFNEGQHLEVSVNVYSREYNGRYFHNIDAWDIQVLDGVAEESSGSDGMPF